MSAHSTTWLDTPRSIGVDVQRLLEGSVFVTRMLVTRLVDDPDDTTETVDFSYRGVAYQIDLSTRNARALDKLLAPYLEVSRRRGTRSGTQRRATKAPSSAPAVRAWAKSQGIEVADRGRVSTDVLNRYREAHVE